MNLALIIGGAWLGIMVVLGAALSRIGRRLNRHVALPEDAEDAQEPGPGPESEPGPGPESTEPDE